MHCCLPGCSRKLDLRRRLRAQWYCCETHFRRDKQRRELIAELRHGLETPMRCANQQCNTRIGFVRRLLAKEFCSEKCFQAHGSKSRPTASSEIALDYSYGQHKVRIPRGMFVHVMFAALILGFAKVFSENGMRIPQMSLHLPQPSTVSFSARIDSWKLADLNTWTSLSSLSPAWRLEDNVLRVIGTMLLNVQEAIAGTLNYRFSLSDNGSAKFLLASDAASQRCLYVELISSATQLTLTPFSKTLDGVITRLGSSCVIDRGNKSLHDVSIAFSDSTIDILFNGERRGWSKLALEPGRVGLTSQERDEFRVFRADVALTS